MKKFFYVLSAIFVLLFLISIIYNWILYCTWEPQLEQIILCITIRVPFYEIVILKALQYLTPATIFFITGKIIEIKETKNKK